MNAQLTRVSAGPRLGPPGAEEVVAGRPQLIRAMNEETVINALRRSGPLMRADLERLSGLSKPTVGLVLANLERAGLVRVAGRRTGGRGPAALLYEVNPMAGFVLALDVGGEYVRGAVSDLSRSVLARSKRGVHAASTASRMSVLVELAEELTAQAGVRRRQVSQTIVGSPGIHDPDGDILNLAMKGWEGPGVLAQLRAEFGERTIVANDVNLAALAEHDHGHGRQADTFAFVSVGTGIGMGLVLGGKVHVGDHGAAGELGFIPAGPARPLRKGGTLKRGALEQAASAVGVIANARRHGMRGRLSAKSVFDAAAGGDPRAAAVVHEQAVLIAQAVASVVTVVDPGLVVLGGGIGSAPGFAEAVGRELAKIVPVVPDVVPSALGDEAIVDGGLVAALDAAWHNVLES